MTGLTPSSVNAQRMRFERAKGAQGSMFVMCTDFHRVPMDTGVMHGPELPHGTTTRAIFGDTSDPHTLGEGAQKFAKHVQDAARLSAGQRVAGTTRTV